MTRLIVLTSKASKAEVKGQKSEVLSALQGLGANKKPIEFSSLKSKLKKLDPKVIRLHVRALVADKLATVKVQKKAA